LLRTKGCDGLVVRRQFLQQPHHFHVAARLAFQQPTRSHPIQVTIHVQLQQIARMIGRSSVDGSDHARKPQRLQIKLIHKGIDKTNWIFHGDVLV
jgi:hypothetical protein